MNFQQLRSIREAARRNYNLTEVANALFTSQPGVSRQIRELEDELGVVIFERNGKRLTGLSDPGRASCRSSTGCWWKRKTCSRPAPNTPGRKAAR